MQKQHKKIYNLLLVFFCLAFLFAGFLAYAAQKQTPLELNYPKIPGLPELVPGQPLSFYVKYFLNLIYFIAAGIAVLTLVWGGITYLAGSSKPTVIVAARARINRALLGLALLLSSYLVLFIINPGLLIFDPQRPDTGPYVPAKIEDNKTVRVVRAGGVSVPERIIDNLMVEAEVKNRTGQMVKMSAVEVPFFKTRELLEEAVEITTDLEKLIKGCGCGNSQTHIEEKGIFGSFCQEGLDEDGVKAVENYVKGKPFSQQQQKCLLQCDDCGTSHIEGDEVKGYNCDLRKVRRQVDDKNPDDSSKWIYEIQTQINPEKWQTISDTDKKTALKYKKIRLNDIMGQLKALNTFDKTLDYLAQLSDLLTNNATKYFISEAYGNFQVDFNSYSNTLEQGGLVVDVQMPPHLNPGASKESNVGKPSFNDKWGVLSFAGKLFLNLAPWAKAANEALDYPIDDPTAFYAVIEGSVVPSIITQKNKEALNNSSRANLFSALTDIHLEAIQGFFQECLQAALVQGEYKLTYEEVQKIIREALDQGGMEMLAVIAKSDPRFSDVFKEFFYQSITDKLKLAYGNETGSCLGKCERICIRKENEECYKPCEEKCKTVPDNFLSKNLTRFLAEPISKPLDELLNNNLFKTLQEFLFDDPTRERLNKDLIAMIDPVVNNALTKSFVEQSGWLKEQLNKKITDVKFLDFATNKLLAVDEFLRRKIECLAGRSDPKNSAILKAKDCIEKTCKAKSGSENEKCKNECNRIFGVDKIDALVVLATGCQNREDVFASLSSKLTSLLLGSITDSIEGFKRNHSGMFEEYVDFHECVAKLERGFYFVPGDSPFTSEFEQCKTDCNKITNLADKGLCLVNCDGKNTDWEISPGICKQMSAEEINNDSFLRNLIVGVETLAGKIKPGFKIAKEGAMNDLPQSKETICRGAGYCWAPEWKQLEANYQININDPAGACKNQCDKSKAEGLILAEDLVDCKKGCDLRFPNGISQKDAEAKIIQGASICQECTSFTADLGKLRNLDWSDAGAWLVNFGQKAVSAIVETVTYTTFRFMEVWVEDEFLTPLKPYLSQVVDFQSGLSNFLDSNISKLLPSSINNVLNKNLDQIFGEICQNAKNGQSYTIAPYKWEGASWENKPLVSWKEKEVTISADVGDAACDISKHLHSSLLDELSASSDTGKKIVEALNTQIIGLLPKEWQCYLNLTPSELIFNGLGVSELIKTTPVDMLCSDVWTVDLLPLAKTTEGTSIKQCSLSDDKKSVVASEMKAVPKSVASVCDSVKTVDNGNSISLTVGIDGAKFNTLLAGVSDTKKKIIRAMCNFRYYACENPLDRLPKINENAKDLILTSCSLVDKRVVEISKGKVSCSDWIENGFATAMNVDDANLYQNLCSGCDLATKRSLAFSIMYFSIKQTAKTEQEKKNMLEWYWAGFPEWRKMKQDWQKTAKLLGINPIWIDADMKKFVNLNAIPDDNDIKKMGQILLSWFSTHQNVEGVLTILPLGVIKPEKEGDATLFREKGQGSRDKNFLNLTPYQLLKDEACKKVVKDFETNFPNSKFESVMQRITPDEGLAYSMQSLERVNVHRTFLALQDETKPNSVSQADWNEYLSSYTFCKSLDYSVGQILGLSEPLYTYIRPKEYQILVKLFDDKEFGLRPEEMPSALRKFLDIIKNQSPVSYLSNIGNQFNQNGGRLKLFGFSTKNEKVYEVKNGNLELKSSLRPLFVEHPQLNSVSREVIRMEWQEGSILSLKPLPTDLEAGMVDEGKIDRWLIPGTNYIIEKTSNSFGVYLFSDLAGGQLTALSEILNTKIGDLINQSLNKRIIDYLPKEWRERQILCAKGEDAEVCGEYQKFLLRTPVEALDTYLNKDLPLPNMPAKIKDILKKGIMGVLSKNSFMGEPIIDSLGGIGGLDQKAFNAYLGAKDVEATIKGGVEKVQSSVQDTFNKAFLQTPDWLWGKVSGLFSNLLANNRGKQVGGECRETKKTVVDGEEKEELIISQADCIQGEFFRDSNGKKQCCNQGDSLVCSSRCRLKKPEEKCKVYEGEEQVKMKVDGRDELACCYKKDSKAENCLKCRKANAVEVENKRCSRDGEQKSNSPDGTILCCSSQTLKTNEGKGINTEQCCVSVTQCVSDKFLGSLESMMAEMMAKGIVPYKDEIPVKPAF